MDKTGGLPQPHPGECFAMIDSTFASFMSINTIILLFKPRESRWRCKLTCCVLAAVADAYLRCLATQFARNMVTLFGSKTTSPIPYTTVGESHPGGKEWVLSIHLDEQEDN